MLLGLFFWAAAGWGTRCPAADAPSNGDRCARIVQAEVVAIDQCLIYNRYGTALPNGMIYALRRDVISNAEPAQTELQPGAVILRVGKRPRPIVLRVNEGDCLEIRFTNLLAKDNPGSANPSFLKTRVASVHVQGLEVVDSLSDDGSWVGKNQTQASLVQPGDTFSYRLFARKEGIYYLFSQGVDFGNPSQLSSGLFGMVIVEPKGSAWYRSQVTRQELVDSQVKGAWGPHGHPVINYDAADAQGTPILKMLKPKPALGKGKIPAFELCHSDLTAIIAGPDEPGEDRWLFRHPEHRPDDNPLYPRSWEPFREFAIIYHDLIGLKLTAPFNFGSTLLNTTLGGGNEAFAINYGSVGISTEIWSNRMQVGPGVGCARRQVRGVLPQLLDGWRPRPHRGYPRKRSQAWRRAGDQARPDGWGQTQGAAGLPAVGSDGSESASARPQGDGRLLSGRSIERLSQLPERPREVPGDARRREYPARPSPARAPVAAHAGRQ